MTLRCRAPSVPLPIRLVGLSIKHRNDIRSYSRFYIQQVSTDCSLDERGTWHCLRSGIFVALSIGVELWCSWGLLFCPEELHQQAEQLQRQLQRQRVQAASLASAIEGEQGIKQQSAYLMDRIQRTQQVKPVRIL